MQKPGQNLTFSQMYKDYLLEREGAQVVEAPGGFAIYKLLNEGTYLQDIYVEPKLRQKGVGQHLLDSVVDKARQQGHTFVLGSCDINANGATTSMKAILGSGFNVQSINGTMIYFKKDII